MPVLLPESDKQVSGNPTYTMQLNVQYVSGPTPASVCKILNANIEKMSKWFQDNLLVECKKVQVLVLQKV